MSDLTLVAVGKDREAVAAFSVPSHPGVLVTVNNQKGSPLSIIGNYHLEHCTTAVFGLCHADAVFGPGALEAFTAEALRGSVCGSVGVDLDGVYHCSYTAARKEPRDVSTLDGMAVFFRADLGLRFDSKTFDGFHCHVEDLCLQAHLRGIPVTVPAADADHRNHQQSPEWLEGYRLYRVRLAEKWKGTRFATT